MFFSCIKAYTYKAIVYMNFYVYLITLIKFDTSSNDKF